MNEHKLSNANKSNPDSWINDYKILIKEQKSIMV